MSALVDFIVEIGSAVAVAICASTHRLKAVLVAAIAKTRNSDDLRYIIRRTVGVVCAILALALAVVWLAYKLASSEDGEAPNKFSERAPQGAITNPAAKNDEYLSNPLDKPPQSVTPPLLQSPHAETGGADRSSGI